MPKRISYDPLLVGIPIVLVILGVIMIYSSSAIMAWEKYKDPYFFVKRQISWVIISLVLLVILTQISYERVKKASVPLMFIGIMLLLILLIPNVGKSVGGAKRWINLGPFSFQPSEFMKVALLFYLAKSLAQKGEKLKLFVDGYLPYLIILTSIFFLIMMQPDFGSVVVLGATAFLLFFVAGVPMRFLLPTFLAALLFGILAVYSVSFRRTRVFTHFDPWQDPMGSGFQMVQSFLALGQGGLFGLGLGEGKQKLFYLPAPHNDFIFAVIGEELGFIGTSVVLILFAILIWKGLRIAFRCTDPFGCYLSFGLTLSLALQVITNVGVVTGLLPTKGLPLPFISLGGSSLIANMASIGLLLKISEETI